MLTVSLVPKICMQEFWTQFNVQVDAACSPHRGITIWPVAFVLDRELSGAPDWVLHHTGEVPDLGHQLGLAGAVLVVCVGDDWHLKQAAHGR